MDRLGHGFYCVTRQIISENGAQGSLGMLGKLLAPEVGGYKLGA